MNYRSSRRTSMLRQHRAESLPSVRGRFAVQSSNIGGSGSNSAAPTYSIFSNQSHVREGQNITFTLITTNVADGVSIPYNIAGITQNDLSVGNTSGNFSVNDNQASITLTMAEDLVSEGNETLTMTAAGDSVSVLVRDTSTGVVPTYELTCTPATVAEGGTITCTLETTNVANGTSVGYTVTGITSDDLSSGTLTGNFVINNNSSTKTFVIANDASVEDETFIITCDNILTPAEIPITDNETPLPSEGQPLFNKSTFIGVVPEPYLTYLNDAADRWATYIKFNSDAFNAIKSTTFGWNGIKLQSYLEINNSSSGIIASCGPYFYYDVQTSGPGVQFNTKSFRLTINTHFASAYNSADWINILTHELGHALGIGVYWQSVLQSTGAVPPTNFFLLSSGYPTAQEGYNAIAEDSSLIQVPLETSGGSGTSSAHWEDNLRPSSAAGSLGKTYPGLTNELMVGFYTQGMTSKISQLSIGVLRDFGYEEVTPGASEGLPTVASLTTPFVFSTSMDSASSDTKTIKLDCCCNFEEMQCAGTIVLSSSEVF